MVDWFVRRVLDPRWGSVLSFVLGVVLREVTDDVAASLGLTNAKNAYVWARKNRVVPEDMIADEPDSATADSLPEGLPEACEYCDPRLWPLVPTTFYDPKIDVVEFMLVRGPQSRVTEWLKSKPLRTLAVESLSRPFSNSEFIRELAKPFGPDAWDWLSKKVLVISAANILFLLESVLETPKEDLCVFGASAIRWLLTISPFEAACKIPPPKWASFGQQYAFLDAFTVKRRAESGEVASKKSKA